MKGLDQLKAEHKEQVDSLKQTIAQLTQERDRLAKGAAPAPRKEAVEKAIAIDRAAIVARLVSDPPVPATIIDTVETILKEQAVR